MIVTSEVTHEFGCLIYFGCKCEIAEPIPCKECKGSGKPTRKHSDLADKCEDCGGSGNEQMESSKSYHR